MMDFQTPHWVCDKMVEMLSCTHRSVLEPTPGEGNLVQALERKGFDVFAPIEFWAIPDRILGFDAIVMNPPFSPMKEGYKILYKCMDMTDRIIALMPWLTIINSEKRTADIMDFGLKSIHHLPRSVFKGSRVQTCILNMDRNHVGDTKFYHLKE